MIADHLNKLKEKRENMRAKVCVFLSVCIDISVCVCVWQEYIQDASMCPMH